MNLFQKYGIKEVADVTFYSITAVGDEEFYTPVLFLDTLKVSTLEKSAEKVEAKGGKGNKKLITWNFGKEITLNLEDALFSPASMSMIWGGKLNSKLSDYTSAIVKSNLANKYGDLHYSIKAYPSPALTDDEWEIVFQQAQKLEYDSGSGVENPNIYISSTDTSQTDSSYISENRNSFIQNYFKRKFSYQEEEISVSEYNNQKNLIDFFSHNSPAKPYKKGVNSTTITYLPVALTIESAATLKTQLLQNTKQEYGSYIYTGTDAFKYYYKKGSVNAETWDEITEVKTGTADFKIRYFIRNDKIYPDTRWGKSAIDLVGGNNSTFISLFGNNIRSCNSPVDFLKVVFGEDFITDESIFSGLMDTNGYAMPPIIIQNIMEELTSIDRIGYIDTDINDIEVIDRMEKCIVTNKKGLTISASKQKENLFRYYSDDKTSSYTIYYDAKTMLPLFRIANDNIVDDDFTIKIGTVYYKWTRTVKYKQSSTDDTILGKTLVIDADTFPDAYKIVGETYIRNQKTGKDQRYQFVIHRATVTTDTSITLEAEGDPTTFSMSIDVLSPPNDVMMELKQYDVEDDTNEGGTRIVPQKSKYTYTPTNITYIEEVSKANEEIY